LEDLKEAITIVYIITMVKHKTFSYRRETAQLQEVICGSVIFLYSASSRPMSQVLRARVSLRNYGLEYITARPI